MVHVLRCHFIAVFSKSLLAWPTPASTDIRLCRHKRPCLVYAEDVLQMCMTISVYAVEARNAVHALQKHF